MASNVLGELFGVTRQEWGQRGGHSDSVNSKGGVKVLDHR